MFVKDVMDNFLSAEKKTTATAAGSEAGLRSKLEADLRWFTLGTNGAVNDIKRIPGTHEEHEKYHESFFHPDKERYLGDEDALIDQFIEQKGASVSRTPFFKEVR